MTTRPVFYLKINTNSDFSLACFWHWVDIVKEYGSDYIVVCDNNELKSIILSVDSNIEQKFISSSSVGKDKLKGLVTAFWLNTGAALLTPFIDAKNKGLNSFFNIDADDTVMLCEASKCAEALRKAQLYADNATVNCFSLDMHSSSYNRFYRHWTFGITYVKMDVDYFIALEKIRSLHTELKEKELNLDGNIDELFKNLGLYSFISLGVFYVDNLIFRHQNWEINIWKNNRYLYKSISNSYKYLWHLSETDLVYGLDIPDYCVKIDIGISEKDCVEFMLKNKTLSDFTPEMEINLLAKELSKFASRCQNFDKLYIYGDRWNQQYLAKYLKVCCGIQITGFVTSKSLQDIDISGNYGLIIGLSDKYYNEIFPIIKEMDSSNIIFLAEFLKVKIGEKMRRLSASVLSFYYKLSKPDNSIIEFTSYINDIARIAKITNGTLGKFYFFGGELLLDKDSARYISVARNYLPNTKFIIVTNGLLLFNDKSIWQTARNFDVIIHINRHTLKTDVESILAKAKTEQVRIKISESDEETLIYAITGEYCDYNCNIPACHQFNKFCTIYNGKLYACPLAAQFTDIDRNYISIDSITHFDEISTFLCNPTHLCKMCDIKARKRANADTVNTDKLNCDEKAVIPENANSRSLYRVKEISWFDGLLNMESL